MVKKVPLSAILVAGFDLIGRVMELSNASVRARRVSAEMSDRSLRDRLLAIRQLHQRTVIVVCDDRNLLNRIFDTVRIVYERWYFVISTQFIASEIHEFVAFVDPAAN
jgi:hypothetical protein